MEITRYSIDNLLEVNNLLKGLSQEQYGRKLEILSGASIGQHVRHIVEFYQCLFNGEESKSVNYDARSRNIQLESDIYFTQRTIGELINELLDVNEDFPVTFIADYSLTEGKTPALIQSTFFRELAYNLEHSIHHQALIKVAITEMKLTTLVKGTFGYAPSTIRNTNTCVR